MYDALVLAGGDARRMGGVDKPALVVGGVTLLDRVLGACASAGRTVVVGPSRPTARPVLWAREDPVGGGPVAALAAGLVLVEAPVVLLLAADLPFLTADTVEVLRESAEAADGSVLVDGRQPQWLCSAWQTSSLRSALAGREVVGASLRQVLGSLDAAWVTWTGAEPELPAPWTDCDTLEDLERARGFV